MVFPYDSKRETFSEYSKRLDAFLKLNDIHPPDLYCKDEKDPTKTKKMAVMISMKGNELSSFIHDLENPDAPPQEKPLSKFLEVFSELKGGKAPPKKSIAALMNFSRVVQVPGMQISEFGCLLLTASKRLKFPSTEALELSLRDQFVNGLLNTRAKDIILERGADWKKSIEIAMEVEAQESKEAFLERGADWKKSIEIAMGVETQELKEAVNPKSIVPTKGNMGLVWNVALDEQSKMPIYKFDETELYNSFEIMTNKMEVDHAAELAARPTEFTEMSKLHKVKQKMQKKKEEKEREMNAYLLNAVEQQQQEKQSSSKNKTSTTITTSTATTNSLNMDMYRFDTVEMLALYVAMALKRVVHNDRLNRQEHFPRMVKVVEHNLKRMKNVSREDFLHTLRDYARLYSHEWTTEDVKYQYNSSKELDDDDYTGVGNTGKITYNTLLLALSIRMGIKKLWIPDNRTVINEEELRDELEDLYKPGKKMVFGLKQLSQCFPGYDFLADHCPGLQGIYIHRCTTDIFNSIVQNYKKLTVLEFNGRVPDRDICRALWGVNKPSENVLKMAMKGSQGLSINLPQLKVLRSVIVMENPTHRGKKLELAVRSWLDMKSAPTSILPMLVSVGAVALRVQPVINIVENQGEWDTMDALEHLLEKEAKNKSGGGEVSLSLRSITVQCGPAVDTKALDRIVKVCPAINSLRFIDAHLLPPQIRNLTSHLPLGNISTLYLDALKLSGRGLLTILSSLLSLEHLTLHLSPDSPCLQDFDATSAQKKMLHESGACRKLETLRLEFIPIDQVDENAEPRDCPACGMLSFFRCFPTITSLHLYDTFSLPPKFLFYGCISGALACGLNLQHLSLIAYHPDMKRDEAALAQFDNPRRYQHFLQVSTMLPILKDDPTFKHFCQLKSLELDEVYVSPRVNRLIEALRWEGVIVRVFYRTNNHMYYGRYDLSGDQKLPPNI